MKAPRVSDPCAFKDPLHRRHQNHRMGEGSAATSAPAAQAQRSFSGLCARGLAKAVFRGVRVHPCQLLGGAVSGLVLSLALQACGDSADSAARPEAVAESVSDGGAEVSSAPEPHSEFVDTDGDGVADEQDIRPEDPHVQTRNDLDKDADGVPDYKDAFPRNSKYSRDSDGDSVPDQRDDFPKDARYSTDSDGDGAADSVDAYPADASRWEVTLGMANAVEAAEEYLKYSAFSRQGLIDQLSSEYGSGFKLHEATWAVGQLRVNWNRQAVRAAKEYLEYSAFSRQGLIDQLSSPYGSQFTLRQATHAVNKVGL